MTRLRSRPVATRSRTTTRSNSASCPRCRRTSRRTRSARRPTAGCGRKTSASSARTRSSTSGSRDKKDKEFGWVFEPDRQIALLKNFWGKLEKDKSLIFFYCNHGNPLDESLNRILLGVSRISQIGPQLYFGTKLPKFPDQYPIWSRCVTHDFENQGFRLPYHEYLKAGHDPKNILCLVPEGAMLNFSYVAEQLGDDMAVGALERLVQSVQAVKDEGKVPGDWDRHLVWLNDVLSEVWQNRGPFPGIGSVLQYLGCESGTAFQRQVLVPLLNKGENAWEYVLAILEGRKKCEQKQYAKAMKQAGERWAAYKEPRRNLLAQLARFELSPAQVERVANPDKRAECGIGGTDNEIVANPYLLCEMDQGDGESDLIALETIDRGMRPEGAAARFIDKEDVCAQDDPRRIRGVAVAVLQGAAQNGDTLLPFAETVSRITKRFPERRACRPDRDLVLGQAAFYQEVARLPCGRRPADDGAQVALRTGEGSQQPPAPAHEGEESAAQGRVELGEAAARRVRQEVRLDQAAARSRTAGQDGEGRGAGETLRRAIQRPVRSGRDRQDLGAEGLPQGAGRTRRQAAHSAPGPDRQGPCAPDGPHEAGRRQRAGRLHDPPVLDAAQVAQPGELRPQAPGGDQHGAPTVIIDEASMIPMDLLGVLFRALDLNKVSRLILVGDPNQLPPIGPGRPLVDIIAWLEADDERKKCLARLMERARHEDHDSQALQLADGYLRDDTSPGDDDMLSRVAREDVGGDLEVRYWRDGSQLEEQLAAAMKKHLKLTDGSKAYIPFNASLGLAEDCEDEQPAAGRALADSQPGAEPRIRHDRDQPQDSGEVPGRDAELLEGPWRREAVRRAGDRLDRQGDAGGQLPQDLATRRARGWITSPTARSASSCQTSKGSGRADSMKVQFSTQPLSSYYYPRPDVDGRTRTGLRPDGP